MILAIERDPFNIIPRIALAFTGKIGQCDKPEVSLASVQRQWLHKFFKEVHNRATTLAGMLPRCDYLVTRRIRKDILGRWDNFVKNNPLPIADLQRNDLNDIEDIQALVESFVDGYGEQGSVVAR